MDESYFYKFYPRKFRYKTILFGIEPDLYKNDTELAYAYGKCIKDEIDQLQQLGCERIQFDEPVLTESPDECVWAADVINDIVDTFPNMYFRLPNLDFVG